MRVIFMGTPDFSVPTLQALADAGHEIVACYSQPPRPAGRRGLELKASPVHQAADAMSIPVYTPTSLKGEDAFDLFRRHDADIAVVVAYGMLLPQAILDVPRHGCLNGHASLLPRWRGAAPIQRAIMAGDDRTGVQVMRMEAGLDTGPVGHSTELPINDGTTAGELHDALAQECATAMVEALAKLEAGTLTFTLQSEEGITYATKISKDETRVNFAEPAHSVLRHVHGLSPFPGAWCEMEFQGKAQRVKLLRCELAEGNGAPGTVLDDGLTIACGTGAIRLTHVQKAGSRPADAATFLRGNAIPAGTVLP